MGEIKSTLDIIMERTKNLTMNEEEKEGLRRTELAERVKGWVQRYSDNRITEKTLKSELKEEGKDNYPMLQELLKVELVESLKLDDDNVKIFGLMKNLLNIKDAPYVKIIKDFQMIAAIEKSKRLEAIKKVLTKKGVRGSAVIPNLDHDTEWNAYYQKVKNDFKKEVLTADT
jgi:hypothetical protein